MRNHCRTGVRFLFDFFFSRDTQIYGASCEGGVSAPSWIPKPTAEAMRGKAQVSRWHEQREWANHRRLPHNLWFVSKSRKLLFLFFRPGTGFPFLSAVKTRARGETPERPIELIGTPKLESNRFCFCWYFVSLKFTFSTVGKVKYSPCNVSLALPYLCLDWLDICKEKKIKHLGGRLEFISDSWQSKYMTLYAGSPWM